MQTPKTFEGSEPTKHIKVKKCKKTDLFYGLQKQKKL
jgi:hypothetical protein